MSMTVPIITLEIERMKHTLMTALSEHTLRIDREVQAAINDYCSEENISAVIRAEVTRQIDLAVKEEVRDFFRYSKPGRQAVREAVLAHLDQWEQS